MTAAAHESGDRLAFLGHLRRRRDPGQAHANLAHPLPPPVAEVPRVRSHLLDEHDLVGSFVANASAASASVHTIDADTVPSTFLDELIARHRVTCAVTSAEPRATAIGRELAVAGVDVAPLSPEAAAAADLGVTSCVAAIATTGTVVVSSVAAGGRGASLLPPVHLCIVPASVIVPSSAEVLRALPDRGPLPSNLVLITGPSRSGDIEQIIALGVHGPVAVEIAVLLGA